MYLLLVLNLLYKGVLTLTIKKFMTYDILLLSFVAILVDVIGYFASRSDLVFLYMSLSLPVILISYIRWNYKALVINLLIIVLHFILYSQVVDLSFFIYLLSLLVTSFSMILFYVFKRNTIKDEVLKLLIYYLSAYLLMFLTQGLAQYLLNQDVQWITLIIRHSVNFIIGFVVLWIASRQEDLMIDMKSYLLKSIEERKKEGNYLYDK
jgi:hypothetical protein